MPVSIVRRAWCSASTLASSSEMTNCKGAIRRATVRSVTKQRPPWRVSTTPRMARPRRASRITGRLTWKALASSVSLGSPSPALRLPERIRSMIWVDDPLRRGLAAQQWRDVEAALGGIVAHGCLAPMNKQQQPPKTPDRANWSTKGHHLGIDHGSSCAVGVLPELSHPDKTEQLAPRPTALPTLAWTPSLACRWARLLQRSRPGLLART